MIVQKKTPEDACFSLVSVKNAFTPYRDAGYGPATYHIPILDVIRGVYKALCVGLLDIQYLNVEQYEFYKKVENADFNWVTNKFLALASPKDDPMPPQLQRQTAKNQSDFYSAYTIDNLIKFMLENNIKTIIRLNNKTYEKKKFIDAGIEHIERNS